MVPNLIWKVGQRTEPSRDYQGKTQQPLTGSSVFDNQYLVELFEGHWLDPVCSICYLEDNLYLLNLFEALRSVSFRGHKFLTSSAYGKRPYPVKTNIYGWVLFVLLFLRGSV